MKLITAFLRLIRWPNLVFIVVTQLLFYYCIIIPVFDAFNSEPVLNSLYLWHIVAASVFIAAAGYIINDYFDLNIDRINKPDKLVVEKVIKRRWTIIWHLVLSFIGAAISILGVFKALDWHVLLAGIINIISIVALWFYSTTYKRKLLIGNIIISLLTAWVILILYLVNAKSWFAVKVMADYKNNYNAAVTKVFKYAILYAGFAFIISLIREVIKDIEDMEGDAKYNCRTMPIAWGIPATKVFAAVWIVVLIGALVILQFYALHLGWWWSVVYCVAAIIAPLVWILRRLRKAQTTEDYYQLSTAVKLVMLTGILSMVFFKLYF